MQTSSVKHFFCFSKEANGDFKTEGQEWLQVQDLTESLFVYPEKIDTPESFLAPFPLKWL